MLKIQKSIKRKSVITYPLSYAHNLQYRLANNRLCSLTLKGFSMPMIGLSNQHHLFKKC